MINQSIASQKRAANILLVEDSKADAAIIKKGLDAADHEFKLRVATDGSIAMEMLSGKAPYDCMPLPDIILLDLSLPKMSGKQVLQTIKADMNLRHIPVIILTGSDGELDLISCYQSYANAYILKPRDMEQLNHLVQSIGSFWLSCALLPSAAGVKRYNVM